jgi:hypothetical protein
MKYYSVSSFGNSNRVLILLDLCQEPKSTYQHGRIYDFLSCHLSIYCRNTDNKGEAEGDSTKGSVEKCVEHTGYCTQNDETQDTGYPGYPVCFLAAYTPTLYPENAQDIIKT